MKTCWAASLGGCGGGFTGEHVVSKALFPNKKVRVLGPPWTAGEPKVIGVNAFTANILCKHHNQALSPVDSEGIAAFHAIRRFEEVLSGRKPATRPSDLRHYARGDFLERWFIKHAVNLLIVSAPTKRWYDGAAAAMPPRDVVQAAFGLQPLVRPRGLYNLAGSHVGQIKWVSDQIVFQVLSGDDGEVLGATFEFQALSFLIWLATDSFEPPEIRWPFVREFYHHVGGEFQVPPLRGVFSVYW